MADTIFRILVSRDGKQYSVYGEGNAPISISGSGALASASSTLAGAATQSSGGALKLLTLNPANSSDPNYFYWDMASNRAGAFRVPEDSYDGSASDPAYSWNYSHGALAVDGSIMYLAGKGEGSDTPRLGSINIPTLVNSTSLGSLNQATVAQAPITLVNTSYPSGWSSYGNGLWIAGLYVVGSELLVTQILNYDQADPSQGGTYNTANLQIYNNKTNIAGATKRGYFTNIVKAAGSTLYSAGNFTGWMSPIPAALQADLGGDTLTGWTGSTLTAGKHSSSQGPAMLTCNIADLTSATSTFDLKRALLYYPKEDSIDDWFSNGPSDMWNDCCQGGHGFIIEGTYTYCVIGFAAGFDSGTQYKGTMSNGVYVDGYSCVDYDDQYPHIWLFDVRDMYTHVANGTNPKNILPYEYRRLTSSEVPFFPFGQNRGYAQGYIGGGHYNPTTGRLWFSLADVDDHGSFYSTPIILAYDNLKTGS